MNNTRRAASVLSAPSVALVALLFALVAATPVFAQSGWSAVRPTPVVTLEIRKLFGMLMLVPAVTLFLLYLFRPRPYVLAGVATWISVSVMLLVLSVDSGSPNPEDGAKLLSVGRLAVGAWAIGALVFGASARCSAVWFRAPSTISRAFGWTISLAAIYTIAAAIWLTPGAVVMPAFLLMTLWHLRAGVSYLALSRRTRMVGALLTGMGIGGLAIVNVAAIGVAIKVGHIGPESTRVAYLNLVTAAFIILGMHLLIFEDVIDELRSAAADLAASRDEMKAMAVTDPLTRCYNRRLLDEISEHELEQHRRYKLPLSILYIDIDHFKAINDTRGHHTGDIVLKTLGEILRQLTRQADYVFRWGGDEFIVLLSAGEQEAKNKANQIRQAFLESAIVGDLPDGVDVSIGCVIVPPETKDFDPLIDQADREMYRRKRALAS